MADIVCEDPASATRVCRRADERRDFCLLQHQARQASRRDHLLLLRRGRENRPGKRRRATRRASNPLCSTRSCRRGREEALLLSGPELAKRLVWHERRRSRETLLLCCTESAERLRNFCPVRTIHSQRVAPSGQSPAFATHYYVHGKHIFFMVCTTGQSLISSNADCAGVHERDDSRPRSS